MDWKARSFISSTGPSPSPIQKHTPASPPNIGPAQARKTLRKDRKTRDPDPIRMCSPPSPPMVISREPATPPYIISNASHRMEMDHPSPKRNKSQISIHSMNSEDDGPPRKRVRKFVEGMSPATPSPSRGGELMGETVEAVGVLSSTQAIKLEREAESNPILEQQERMLKSLTEEER